MIEEAHKAAEALQAALDRLPEKPRAEIHALASGRPKFWHIYRFPDVPGLERTIEGSTRSSKVTVTYTHSLLPGWEYLGHELSEMLDDLRNLAAGKGPPTEATRKD